MSTAAATRITMISSILASTALPAFAATEGRSNPTDLIVWGFIGFCALIVIAQITPQIRSNLNKQSKIAAEQAIDSKQQL